jgi:rhodanese-related sulfurtransferase
LSIPHKTHSPGFLALVQDAKTRVKEVTIDQYKEMRRENHILVDIREDHEWAAGHAEGAIHLSRGTIERDIETIISNKTAKIVLYCGGGFRSALSAESLGKMGYTDAISLDGGWRAWNEAGLPVTQGD